MFQIIITSGFFSYYFFLKDSELYELQNNCNTTKQITFGNYLRLIHVIIDIITGIIGGLYKYKY